MTDAIRPILTGHKSLIVGVANEHSIAYGCARAFREAGAELALTWLNDKARPYVELLAEALGATITAPLNVEEPGALEALFDADRRALGAARQPGSLDRLRAEGRPAGRFARLLRRRASRGRWTCRAIRSCAWPGSPRR